MHCEYCLTELLRFLDVYSFPRCLLVSNEIVFGQQNIDCNSFSSYSNNKLNSNINKCNKINNDIENICIKLNLTKSIITNSSKFYYKLISKKLKSSYSYNFYKIYSILKACAKEDMFIDSQILCSFFNLNNYKFLKFTKYLLNTKIDYIHPPNITQECDKLLNILNVKQYADRSKIVELSLKRIRKSDINIKTILFQVYCEYLNIDIKSDYFKDICLKLNVNVRTIYKYCKNKTNSTNEIKNNI